MYIVIIVIEITAAIIFVFGNISWKW